ASAEIRWQHRLHYGSPGGQPNRRQPRIGCHDDERRPGRGSDKPGFRIRERTYPLQCGRSGGRGQPAAREQSEGVVGKTFADGFDLDDRRHSQCGRLFDRSSTSNRGGAARGRWCACWQMVNRDNSNLVRAERRLEELGIKLPEPPQPFGTYVEAVQTGNLLFLTGMLPTEGRAAKFVGRVGAELDVEAGRKAAHLAALNVLAVARKHLGSLDKVTRIVRLGVSVATS